MIRALVAAAMLVLFASSASAQSGTKSTPEERQGWATTLHKLEANPLDEQTQQEAAHAANRLKDVDDVTISPCGLFTEIPNKWNKSWGIVIYLLGMSAYQVETSKNDSIGENVYAMHSVLKAYASAIAKDPKLRDKKLDSLTQMETEGKLPDLAAKKGCK